MQPTPPQTPGPYPGPNQAALLRAGEFQYLFNQQLIAAGTSSIAVQLERIKSPHFYPFGASLHVFFTNAAGSPSTPGAFEIDWQNSDIDADAQFVTTQSLVGTGSLNASFAGRIELPLMWAKYMRVNLKTMPNAGVYTTALVVR